MKWKEHLQIFSRLYYCIASHIIFLSLQKKKETLSSIKSSDDDDCKWNSNNKIVEKNRGILFFYNFPIQRQTLIKQDNPFVTLYVSLSSCPPSQRNSPKKICDIVAVCLTKTTFSSVVYVYYSDSIECQSQFSRK